MKKRKINLNGKDSIPCNGTIQASLPHCLYMMIENGKLTKFFQKKALFFSVPRSGHNSAHEG